MPPSVHAVVRGGRSAIGPQKAGCVRCGFGFGSALPCRALPPAGRAHARLMRAPLAARSAGAALSTRPTVALLGGSFCWCCPLYPPDCRSLWSLACGHRGATAFGLTLVLCAPDRLLYPSISRRLYRPFLRHLLRSWLGTVAPSLRHSPAVAILYKSAYSIGFYSSPCCHRSSSSLGSSGGLHS